MSEGKSILRDDEDASLISWNRNIMANATTLRSQKIGIQHEIRTREEPQRKRSVPRASDSRYLQLSRLSEEPARLFEDEVNGCALCRTSSGWRSIKRLEPMTRPFLRMLVAALERREREQEIQTKGTTSTKPQAHFGILD